MDNCDYNIRHEDAETLKGIVSVSAEFRKLALEQFAKDHGRFGLIDLFVQFIGLCNSAEQNAQEMVRDFTITEGIAHPASSEKLNTPTIFGALHGVQNVVEPTAGMCHGCAYRLGSIANQAGITALDADWVVKSGRSFYCHAYLDETDEPTRLCVGYARKCAESGVEVVR